WHETLRGIRADMLLDALIDSRTNYYRPVEFRDLMVGGLKGLQAVATTNGLEKAFPGLGDQVKRDSFLHAIDVGFAAANAASDVTEQSILVNKFAELQRVNRQTIDLP